ncbi:unnamed protein product [Microthlaspi erraticum]|uniref:Uncharacterized protein n=1 Tax=Microthlaspi erraticum TaxID=1685480 RepID=A0A6D2IP99_9BRAS|nr:unnamed protein product [Microthlaspi erraticum]
MVICDGIAMGISVAKGPHAVSPSASLPQANPLSLPHNTIGEGPSHSRQPNPLWCLEPIYPQANQARSPPNNMHVSHQVGTQPPQVQRLLPPPSQHVPPPLSLPTMQTFKLNQPTTKNHGFRPQLNYHSATAYPGGWGQAAPCFPALKLSGMEGSKNQVPQNQTSDEATNGVNDVKHDVEIPTPKSKHELKGKRVMEEGVNFESKTRGLGIVGFTYHGFSRDGGSSSLKVFNI